MHWLQLRFTTNLPKKTEVWQTQRNLLPALIYPIHNFCGSSWYPYWQVACSQSLFTTDIFKFTTLFINLISWSLTLVSADWERESQALPVALKLNPQASMTIAESVIISTITANYALCNQNQHSTACSCDQQLESQGADLWCPVCATLQALPFSSQHLHVFSISTQGLLIWVTRLVVTPIHSQCFRVNKPLSVLRPSALEQKHNIVVSTTLEHWLSLVVLSNFSSTAFLLFMQFSRFRIDESHISAQQERKVCGQSDI